MRAWLLPRPGDGTGLTLSEISVPEPGREELLVRVRAVALGPMDRTVIRGERDAKMLRARQYPMIPGFDFSGVVESVGAGVTGRRAGDEIFGFLPVSPSTARGALAEFVIASSHEVYRKPVGVNFPDAAAAASSGMVAVRMISLAGGIRAGRRILVNGAASGVGPFLIQIAKTRAADVWAVGDAAEEPFLRRIGADVVLRGDRDEFDPLAFRFQLVADLADAWSYRRMERLLRSGGAYVTPRNSWRYVRGRLSSMMSSRSCHRVRPEHRDDDFEELARLLASKRVKPSHQASYAMQDVPAAVEQLLSQPLLGALSVVVSSY